MLAGFFSDLHGTLDVSYPFLSVAVRLPHARSRMRRLNLLLDTGANQTIIHPRDAFSLGISVLRLADPAGWPQVTVVTGVGGSTVRYIEPAFLAVLRDDNTLRVFEQAIAIAQANDINEDQPSLLGWDILQHFKLTVDVRTGLVALEE